jgi:DNA-binding transcriptional MerR regulator
MEHDRLDKAPDAFRTISEVAEELDVPQHVLRFWESRFHEIRPLKRGGGRRYYRPQDVDLLRGIRHLLYGEGYTVRGVQRLLREQGHRFVQNVWQPGAPQPSSREQAAAEEVEEGRRALPLTQDMPSVSQVNSPEQQQSEESSLRRSISGPPRLSSEQTRQLQAALRELMECRRMLDATMTERS